MMLSVQNNPRYQQQQGQGSIPAGYNRESFKIEGSIPAGYTRESFKIDYGEHFLSQPDSCSTNQKTQSVETRDGKPKKGSIVAVFGLGAVGLAACEVVRIAGAARIIGIDFNNERYERAKQFGVTEFINPKEYEKPIQQVIAEKTDGGVDYSVECTGSIEAMVQALECCHDGWGVAVLTGVPRSDAVFKTNPVNFQSEKTLKGTFFGNYKPRTDLPGLVEMYLNGELELDKFVTVKVSFADINKAFDHMLKGEGLRIVIKVIQD